MKLSHRSRRNQQGFAHIEVLVALIVIVAISFIGYKLLQQSHAAASCTVSDKLVNSCRPWLGVAANDYSAGGGKAGILDHERRIGKQVDIAHTYHPAGQLPLDSDDMYFLNRANTYLLTNWKPISSSGQKWSAAGGSNAAVNAYIDQAAAKFKAIAPKKVMLDLWHEPENDVSSGTTCTSLKGSMGSPTDYVNMWHNVRARFDAKGVSNVVWVLDYQSSPNWDCLKKPLWPGNSYVDWLMYDSYGAKGWNSPGNVGRMYNWFTANSDSTYNFNSKPWGLGEFGTWQASQAAAYQYYADAKTALDNNTYPKLKAYVVWDSVGTNDSRIDYSLTGARDDNEQNKYKAFVSDPRWTNAYWQKR